MELILTLPKTKERIDYNKDKYLSSGWNKDKDDIELPPTPNSLDTYIALFLEHSTNTNHSKMEI